MIKRKFKKIINETMRSGDLKIRIKIKDDMKLGRSKYILSLIYRTSLIFFSHHIFNNIQVHIFLQSILELKCT